MSETVIIALISLLGTLGGTNSGAAYIRFCLAYTNIDNLVITK